MTPAAARTVAVRDKVNGSYGQFRASSAHLAVFHQPGRCVGSGHGGRPRANIGGTGVGGSARAAVGR